MAGKKANLEQVAQLAGVGIATVDRVLNERGNTSPITARKVIEAARQLKLGRTLPALYQPNLRVEIIMVRADTPYFRRLNDIFVDVASSMSRKVIVQRTYLAPGDAQLVPDRIRETKAHALVVHAEESAPIIEAVKSVVAHGVPVITIATDMPTTERLAYVGIDHYAAGRTAAFLMGGFLPRDAAMSLLVFCRSLAYRSCVQRVDGFRDRLSELFPTPPKIHVVQFLGDSMRQEQLVIDALCSIPDLKGIYSAGGDNDAVGSALSKVKPAGGIVFIGHELTQGTSRLLRDGTMTLAIDQNIEAQLRISIEILLAHFGHDAPAHGLSEVPFQIFGPDNLPAQFRLQRWPNDTIAARAITTESSARPNK